MTGRASARSRGPRPLTRAAAAAIFTRLAEARPDPRTELEYVNPFTLLVAVVLSAQATDRGVNLATRGLFARADTPAKMVALGEAGVAGHIRTIGLWRNKAKNVVALSRIILERYGGETPRDRASLEALPGVGRKTANVVLNEAFGEPTIAVDTHIFRVSNRTGLSPGRTPDQVEAGLERITPEQFRKGAHHWLILHGRYTCLAQTPRCYLCPITDLCRFRDKTPEPGSPEAKAKAAAAKAARAKAGSGKGRPAKPSPARSGSARSASGKSGSGNISSGKTGSPGSGAPKSGSIATARSRKA